MNRITNRKVETRIRLKTQIRILLNVSQFQQKTVSLPKHEQLKSVFEFRMRKLMFKWKIYLEEFSINLNYKLSFI
jgi:predicted HTH domain antitoxin